MVVTVEAVVISTQHLSFFQMTMVKEIATMTPLHLSATMVEAVVVMTQHLFFFQQ
jgi:hypothetical protein